MHGHAIFAEIESALTPLMPAVRVELTGAWTPAVHRTFPTAREAGPDARSLADVIDVYWRGTVRGPTPIAGLAFLVTDDRVFWVKSGPASSNLDVHVSLHAWAERMPDRATFNAGLGGSSLPGIPVPRAPELVHSCSITGTAPMTGQPARIARADPASFGVLLLEGRFLKTGRHRLWRLRDEYASGLPERVRELLTRRRSGRLVRNPA